MVRKKTKSASKENELYVVPSKNDEMKAYVNKFKVDMMEHIVNSIKFAIDNKFPIVEIFQFKHSPFVVTISQKEFRSNLEHIVKFYKEHQYFELAQRVEQLHEIVIKHEKETPENNG